MNTNIPRQTDAAYGKPAQAGYQDGYDNQQAPYSNQMQEKQPLHPSTQGGGTFQRDQFEDVHDPPNSSGFRSERDPGAGYTNPDATHGRVAESERGRFPADQTNANVPGHTDRGTTGYDDVRPAQANYQHDGYGNQQHDGYGNQQQTPYANEFQERQPVQHSTQGEPFQGRNQFDNNAGATGFRPGQDDRGYAGGAHPNGVDAQQMPPNYDSNAGSMYQNQRYPDEKSRVGGQAAGMGVGGNRTGMAAGNNFGDQYDHQKTTTGGAGPAAGNTYGDQYDHQKTTTAGTAGPSWRTDPVGKLTTYLSHPSVATTVNQTLSGGPFSKAQTSVAPTAREARHLKRSGQMEGMVGKMLGSETLRQRGQEKVVMSRNVAVQVQDLKQAGKMEAKAHKLRGKGGGTTMGGAGGVPNDGRANEEFAAHQPMEQQPGGMGPAGTQGSQFPRGY